MDMPLVSVIVPVKNGERFLRAAIESVIAQDYRPVEIVVVDGQSADDTAKIAASFSEVRYVYQQERPGIAEARNLGIATAQGTLISFISCDDLWDRNKLRRQVDYMARHPEVQYTITHVRFFLEPGCDIPAGFRKELLERDPVGPMPETLMARKTLFDEIGPFDASLELLEDNDWFVRARDRGVPTAVIPEVLVFKRIHAGNVSLYAHTAVTINRELLRVARRSIERKRAHAPGPAR